MQPGFQCSSVLKKKVKNVLYCSSLPIFCIAGADIENTVPPAGIVTLPTDIPSDTKEGGFF
jgi:hypothetical protein